MYVKLKNNGESTVEINWGQFHIVLKPGQASFDIAEALAKKFIMANPCLEIIKTGLHPEAIETQSPQEDISDKIINLDRPRVGAGPKRKRGQ